MAEKPLKTFDAPKDENGKLYWIPIVVKNKDFLLGYTEAYRVLAALYDIPLSDMSKTISSDRFNDVFYDGTRMGDMSHSELKKKIKDVIFQNREDNEENDESLYDDYVLSLDCNNCNVFYGFKTKEEISDENVDCPVCGRRIIHYTHCDDDELEYSGYKDKLEKIVTEIHNELFPKDNDE